MSTYSNVLGQITEKETALINCVGQPTAVLFKNKHLSVHHNVTLPCMNVVHVGKWSS